MFYVLAICVIFDLGKASIVHTKLGFIQGTKLFTRNGQRFDAFIGVPYAQPPVGHLRFKSPERLIEPWHGIRNAIKYTPVCPQSGKKRTLIGNEDCLYLNIYTPEMVNRSANLPVWVFIHPGKRIVGQAHPYRFGPSYIMDKPVILVTVFYRLGALGFLSTEDNIIPGNFGLKDQSAALYWIQEHIMEFGGDPKNVTLCGASSGGIDVSMHLSSPLSRGLFHRAISQSGPGMRYSIAFKKGLGREQAWKCARIVGCSRAGIKTSEDLLKCLQTIPVLNLVNSVFSMKYDYILPNTYFGVVIEDKRVENPFLIGTPSDELMKTNNIPWLLGVNSNEGSPKMLTIFKNRKVLEHISRNYKKIFPKMLGYTHLPDTDFITESLYRKYVGVKTFEESFHTLSEMYGFAVFQLGTLEAAIRYKGPTYFYHYDHQHEIPYVREFYKHTGVAKTDVAGPVHNEELLSLFDQPQSFPRIVNGVDRTVSDQIVTLWYNFVKYGNPNGMQKSVWKPVLTEDLEYLHINNATLTMKTNPFWNNYKFWKLLCFPTLKIVPDSQKTCNVKENVKNITY